MLTHGNADSVGNRQEHEQSREMMAKAIEKRDRQQSAASCPFGRYWHQIRRSESSKGERRNHWIKSIVCSLLSIL